MAVDAQRALDASNRPVCLFGHTHLPVIFTLQGTQLMADLPDEELRSLTIDKNASYLINAGSVGQPRDGDPRAAYAVYHTDGVIVFSRVEYNIAEAQRSISAAGLPQSLANRLGIGR